MIIKGKSIKNRKDLAPYLEHQKNEESRLIELRGSASPNLEHALQEWEALAAPTKATKPLYSASINPEQHQRLTDRDYIRAADILEQQIGLTGQPRAIVIQVSEKGRQHAHVVWSRVDLEQMKVISDSHNYAKHNRAAQRIEQELGLDSEHDRIKPRRHSGHGDMVSEQREANKLFEKHTEERTKERERQRDEQQRKELAEQSHPREWPAPEKEQRALAEQSRPHDTLNNRGKDRDAGDGQTLDEQQVRDRFPPYRELMPSTAPENTVRHIVERENERRERERQKEEEPTRTKDREPTVKRERDKEPKERDLRAELMEMYREAFPNKEKGDDDQQSLDFDRNS